MRHRNRSHYNKSNKRPTEKIKFYRNLRSFLIFNIAMAGLWLAGSGLSGLWALGKIWAIFLVIQYVKVNGLPGTKGWLSKDWEDWMETRATHQWEEEPEEMVMEPEPEKVVWRERDLV